MKRRHLVFGILAGMAVLVILTGPAAPLLIRLGIEPACIQGDFPNIQFVSCSQSGAPPQAVTPLPIPTLEGQTSVPLIFDDDGSPDGTIALLFFLSHPHYEVKAVTISPGEAHPELFARHVVRLLAWLGRSDIPVGFGRETPLEGDNAFPVPWRQTSDAFWDIPLPEANGSSEPLPAAGLIVDVLHNSPEPVAVFISGTHTNLAEALRRDPSIAGRIRDAYVMGGSIYVPGNIESAWPEIHNSVSEWNIWVDPVAAREVFNAGIRLSVMPLDGTNRVTWTDSDADLWASAESAAGQLSANLLRWMLSSWPTDSAYIWDLAAAVALTDPGLCPLLPLALDIVVEAGPEQGRTVITDQSPNVTACLEPDTEQIKMRVETILAGNP